MSQVILTSTVVFFIVVFLVENSSMTEAKKRHQKQSKIKPNIVVIMVDDVGWNDVGYNNPKIKTPTINALSRHGITLDYHYTLPICSPSRSSFMTGRYPKHNNFYSTEDFGVAMNEVFLSQKLQKLGYSTNAIGKWHLGFSRKEYLPTSRGFDYFYGFLGGSETYFTHASKGFSQCGSHSKSLVLDLYRNDEEVRNQTGVYSTFLFTREAVNVIHRHDPSKPLFLYFAHQDAHAPMEVPKEYSQKYMNIKNIYRRKFMAKMTLLDEAVMNVTQALKKKKLWKNTILIFLSDNGAHHLTGSNWPLRGFKGTLFEGGIRNVAFLQGGVIKKGGFHSKTIVHISDWLPTLLGRVEDGIATTENIDGVNVWDSIMNNRPSKRNYLIHRIYDILAIRTTRWKLLLGQKEFPHVPPPEMEKMFKSKEKSLNNIIPVALYNMKRDPYEKRNVACKYRNIVSNLVGTLKRYFEKNFFSTKGRACDKRATKWAELHGVWGPWLTEKVPGLNTGRHANREQKRQVQREKKKLLAHLNTRKLLRNCDKTL